MPADVPDRLDKAQSFYGRAIAKFGLLSFLSLGVSLAGGTAFAQTTGEGSSPTTGASGGISAPASNAASDPVIGARQGRVSAVQDPGPYFSAPMGADHFFGDWGGIQPWLLDHGIHLLASINEEFFGNFTGGKQRAYSDAGQVGLELDVDWERLAGLRNFWTHMLVVNGHGQNVSRNFGDSIAGVQEIYGARGNVVAHLVSMYGERSFLHNRVDLSVGVMPVGSFFMASPLFCDFINVAICGNPAPNKYTPGNRDWPSANIGAVLRVMPTNESYIMAGIFAVSPHAFNGGISGWALAQDGLGKLSTPIELGWTPSFGKSKLIGHYKLGYSYDNSQYPNLYEDKYGNSYLRSGLAARKEAGMNSMWLLADQMLIRNGEGQSNGLVALAGAMYDDGKTVAMRDHEWAGIIETGKPWGRPLDTVGAMYQHFDMSRSVTLQQESAQELGLPFPSNQWGQVWGVQSHENTYELFYSAHVGRAMALEPDFQYIQRPGASTVFHDAAVLGVQFTVVL
ncbi:carbohydrate porin [Kozakia baliensis]|uniref:Porin n=1 Tax=Kozakia baliensis TaxID=153496 RepID=A0A1D8UV53_9PROT|nr:carbohydrate porin [Kozakia baliensis]AOX17521.1 porin [Kozakia baliensis]GBR30836.1 carbohydrate-selective porin B [Kozakia baliensis NRIC 0488]GEL63011.1 porin [Kozakia baliensis]